MKKETKPRRSRIPRICRKPKKSRKPRKPKNLGNIGNLGNLEKLGKLGNLGTLGNLRRKLSKLENLWNLKKSRKPRKFMSRKPCQLSLRKYSNTRRSGQFYSYATECVENNDVCKIVYAWPANCKRDHLWNLSQIWKDNAHMNHLDEKRILVQ